MYIKKIIYNWFYTNTCQEESNFEIGKRDVIKIEKVDRFPGAREVYFKVHFANGSVADIYNVNQVVWAKWR